MLKRIKVNQLMLGMHLTEFCGSWMEQPLWRTAYILTDAEDIAAILASNIQEVWIDCAQGLDIAVGETAVSEAESGAQVGAELKQVAHEKR